MLPKPCEMVRMPKYPRCAGRKLAPSLNMAGVNLAQT